LQSLRPRVVGRDSEVRYLRVSSSLAFKRFVQRRESSANRKVSRSLSSWNTMLHRSTLLTLFPAFRPAIHPSPTLHRWVLFMSYRPASRLSPFTACLLEPRSPVPSPRYLLEVKHAAANSITTLQTASQKIIVLNRKLASRGILVPRLREKWSWSALINWVHHAFSTAQTFSLARWKVLNSSESSNDRGAKSGTFAQLLILLKLKHQSTRALFSTFSSH